MFVKLHDLDYDSPDFSLEHLHAAVATVQEETSRFKGTIARLLADDKGTRFKLAFGMPTMNHGRKDDCTRATMAALRVQRLLKGVGITTSIGIGFLPILTLTLFLLIYLLL